MRAQRWKRVRQLVPPRPLGVANRHATASPLVQKPHVADAREVAGRVTLTVTFCLSLRYVYDAAVRRLLPKRQRGLSVPPPFANAKADVDPPPKLLLNAQRRPWATKVYAKP